MLQELPEGRSKQKQSDFNFMVLFKCVLSRWQQHLHSTHPADHNIQTYTSLARYYMHVKTALQHDMFNYNFNTPTFEAEFLRQLWVWRIPSVEPQWQYYTSSGCFCL